MPKIQVFVSKATLENINTIVIDKRNFNQTEFNKVILENVVKTSFICQKLLGINSFMSEIQDNEKLDYKLMAYAVRNDTAEVINEFFPKNEENT
ncbi:relaxosome protein TraM [Candidatus Regiella insecticola]|uniref:relaxosome protein TraM n=1 Tax=Candidatus Regiella insecticola TaxID=138073 RepID=UPI001596EC83|nr:relaxosome protein TraM [Candidatus Regiella insecticola]